MSWAGGARWAAWLVAPLILAAQIAVNGLGEPTYVMGDFRAFYCAGSAVAHGANPYLEEPLRGCETTAGPPAEPAFLRPVALPAPLPPYALLLFVPFSRLPFPAAAIVFGLLSIAAMCAAVVMLQRVTGASSVVLNLALAAITATVSLYVGQPMPFVFAALAGAALCARGGRWARRRVWRRRASSRTSRSRRSRARSSRFRGCVCRCCCGESDLPQRACTRSAFR
jgi:hypothetical protein